MSQDKIELKNQYCPYCNKRIHEKESVCEQCGQDLSVLSKIDPIKENSKEEISADSSPKTENFTSTVKKLIKSTKDWIETKFNPRYS